MGCPLPERKVVLGNDIPLECLACIAAARNLRHVSFAPLTNEELDADYGFDSEALGETPAFVSRGVMRAPKREGSRSRFVVEDVFEPGSPDFQGEVESTQYMVDCVRQE